MTLTVGNHALQVTRVITFSTEEDVNVYKGSEWTNTGIRWTTGQRVNVRLTRAQPAPALPLAAAGLLALLLGVGAYRRVVSRN